MSNENVNTETTGDGAGCQKRPVSKIWVVFEDIDYEGDTYWGAFSTYEKAIAASLKIDSKFVSIRESEIDELHFGIPC